MKEIARLKSALTGDFTVTARPEPIPGDLRVGWGQALLLLVLASSKGMRCSLQKVHFLAHLSRGARSRAETRQVLARNRSPAQLSVRIEPWVNRAIAFGKANGLVEMQNGKALTLTEAGKAIADKVREAGVLVEETTFLDEIGRIATEKMVDSIIKMESF
jgi:hypothetical protein